MVANRKSSVFYGCAAGGTEKRMGVGKDFPSARNVFHTEGGRLSVERTKGWRSGARQGWPRVDFARERELRRA